MREFPPFHHTYKWIKLKRERNIGKVIKKGPTCGMKMKLMQNYNYFYLTFVWVPTFFL